MSSHKQFNCRLLLLSEYSQCETYVHYVPGGQKRQPSLRFNKISRYHKPIAKITIEIPEPAVNSAYLSRQRIV